MQLEMIPAVIDEHVDRGVARYRAYHSLMRGALSELIPIATFDHRLTRELAKSLRVNVAAGTENEVELIRAASAQVLTIAGVSAPGAEEAAAVALEHVAETIGVRLVTDARSIQQVFRKVSLKAFVASQQSNLYPQELFRRAYLETMDNFAFKQRDKAGRLTGSEVVWRLMLRSHYYGLVNEISMMGLAAQGEKLARVFAPGHDYHDLILSLGQPVDDKPIYDQIAADVFHPNSDALIVKAA